MTTTDSTPDNGIFSTPILIQQLTHLEEQLSNLLACYQFYDQAIRAITHPEHDEFQHFHHSYFGLFLTQQWLTEQGETVITDLQHIKQALRD